MCWIEDIFPRLLPGNYRPTSKATNVYNSIAWSIGEDENDRYWWPDPIGIYYWPDDVVREETLDAFTMLYLSLGYELTSNRELELGFEKVALYFGEDSRPTHAARQLGSGKWTSKILDAEDIEHNSLSSLEGELLGDAGRIFKRPTKNKLS